jgi:hypothetical protein
MAAFAKLANSICNALNGFIWLWNKVYMWITYWDMSKNDVIGGHFKFKMAAFTKAANIVNTALTRLSDPAHVAIDTNIIVLTGLEAEI